MSTGDSTKQFAVNWNNHMNHVKKAFDDLLSSNEFTDVTLYVEGRKIGAHKMLLSACSAYFRDIFREFPQDRPIIILKGVKYRTLTDILKFIYNGEVSVDSEHFDGFLQTAEFLQISGLTEGDKSQNKNLIDKNNVSNNLSDININNPQEGSIKTETAFVKEKKLRRRSSAATDSVDIKKLKESDTIDFTSIKCEPSNELSAMFDESLMDAEQQEAQTLLFPTASNMFQEDNLKTDVEFVAVEDVSEAEEGAQYDENETGSPHKHSTAYAEACLRCKVCNKQFSHPYSLHHHKAVHSGSTECPVCHVVLSRKYNLKLHMKSRHNMNI